MGSQSISPTVDTPDSIESSPFNEVVNCRFRQSQDRTSSPAGSASVEKTLLLCLNNDRSQVTQIVNSLLTKLEEFEIISESDRLKVGIALEEALTNAIIHGNLEVCSALRERNDSSYERMVEHRFNDPHYGSRKVLLVTTLTKCQATIRITDQGPGFDVSNLPDPTDAVNLDRPCGRGILLMRSFMDSVQYNATGNSVTLIKLAANAPAVDEAVVSQ